ncbi:MAG TPA: hypothetical protein VG672_30445 [Bryobacteraceae bacterium]|jgi:hypothetical protein|nr:hypothetical protein [Bryobacteraceae bacterium]
MRLVSILLLAGGVMSAAPPTIRDIKFDSLTHASVRWTFTVTPASYVQIQYGTSSSSYPYRSVSYGKQTVGAIAIGGLQPGTEYYFRITARPNPDDDDDLCADESCGSAEQILTTPPEPETHPEPPVAPTEYTPQHPDTSAYTVVPMRVDSTGECVAAQDVSVPGWRRDVHEGDKIPAVLGAIHYGTVVEFPAGATCKVFPTNSVWNAGYTLPVLPIDPEAAENIDSPAHRWIVFRTAATNPADLPPFGTRTGPTWAAKLAKLEVQEPATGPGGVTSTTGQIFDVYNTNVHHFWFENLELTHTTSTGVTPADSVDPKPFSTLIRIQPHTAKPQYIVLDRIYAHGGGFPTRSSSGIMLGGRNEAMLGCYLKFDFWRLAGWPTQAPTLADGNATLQIPRSTFQRNRQEAAQGMTDSATAVLQAPTSYSGIAFGYLGPDGLTIEYTANSEASIACTGCTASAVDTPTVPQNRYKYFSVVIANGQFTNLKVYTSSTRSSYWGDWKPVTFQFVESGTGPYRIENNYFEAPGQTVYVDPGGSNTGSSDDVVFRRNYLYWNQDHRPRSSTWNGYRYNVRNMLEVKRGRRWLLDGNVFEGAWSYQNAGYAILIAGAYPYDPRITNSGTSDFTITNNIIRHSATGWQCAGAGLPPPDAPTAQRISFRNNLLYDLNRSVYDDNGPGTMSGYMTMYPGCQDVTIRNNTFGLALGKGPYLMLAGGGAALGEGLSVTNNIMYMSIGDIQSRIIAYDNSQNITSHPRLPQVNSSSAKDILDTFFVRAGQTVIPSYAFTNNVIIGGQVKSAGQTLRDMTQAEVDRYAGQFPAGNIFPKGNSMALREEVAGLLSAKADDFRLASANLYEAVSGGSMGANLDDLQAAAGLVTGILPVQVGRVGALFSYTAPDGNACSVDTSTDGITWARVSDGGGARSRVVTVSGLTPGTNYQYRILCAYEQVNDDTLLTKYPDDQVTNGSFQTTP